jgi:hypothetical protein
MKMMRIACCLVMLVGGGIVEEEVGTVEQEAGTVEVASEGMRVGATSSLG